MPLYRFQCTAVDFNVQHVNASALTFVLFKVNMEALKCTFTCKCTACKQ